MTDALTLREWALWRRFYDDEPWGPERDDARSEVMRLRLLGSFAGQHHSEMTPWEYPYSTANAMAEEAEKLERAAEKMRAEKAAK